MWRYSIVVVVILILAAAAAAAAAVAVLVVNEAFLEEVIGVFEAAVVMAVVMFVKLYRPDHVDATATAFLLASYN